VRCTLSAAGVVRPPASRWQPTVDKVFPVSATDSRRTHVSKLWSSNSRRAKVAAEKGGSPVALRWHNISGR
jgi:hypothetical protein